MTRREFCTIQDSAYLARGVALHSSLARHCPNFRLTVLCADEQTRRIYDLLAMPGVRTMPIAELEQLSPALLAVKPGRTVAEYCWTAKSVLLEHMLRAEGAAEVTYLDADLFFYGDPAPLFEEMGAASVMITPHRFHRDYDASGDAGVYNAGFITFRADEPGLVVLDWWRDRCIEWCYARFENGKRGDQNYLDDWTTRFEGVHPMEHPGGAVGPWNLERYEIRERGGVPFVGGAPLVFFHFHHLRMLADGGYLPNPAYRLSAEDRNAVYRPYMRALDEAMRKIRTVEPGFDAGLVERSGPIERLRSRLSRAAYIGSIRAKRRFALLGLPAVAKAATGDGIRARVWSSAPILRLRRLYGKLGILRRYGVRPYRKPISFARYLLFDPELDNFTYETANEDELAAMLAEALGLTGARVAELLAEATGDAELDRSLRDRLRRRRDKKRRPLYGRRLGWYVVARALRPAIVVETGIHDGLGSSLLLSALARNAAEGSPGRLISVDVDSEAGWLVPESLRDRWQPVIESTYTALPRLLDGEQVGMLIHDSEHTYECERFEFDVAMRNAAPRLALISDNAHATDALRDLAREHGLAYHHFLEQPKSHFYPGAALGLAIVEG